MHHQLKAALGALAQHRQFFVWRLYSRKADGKFEKEPLGRIDHSNPANWTTFDEAVARCIGAPAGECYVPGLYLTRELGAFLIDLDHLPAPNTLDEDAKAIHARFPGAMEEWSSSERGRHIIGRYDPARVGEHKKQAGNIEVYTHSRGVALSANAVGSADVDHTDALLALLSERFAPTAKKSVAGGVAPDPMIAANAMHAWLRKIAAAEPGTRNDVMKDAAFALGGYVVTGALDEAMAQRALYDAALAAGWENLDKVRRTISSSMAKGKGHPILVPAPLPAPLVKLPAPLPQAASKTTELSNAIRICEHFGRELMHVEGIGWHVWEGNGPWRLDDNAAYRMVSRLGRIIGVEASALDAGITEARDAGLHPDEVERREKEQTERRRWARASESRTVLTNSRELARTFLSVPADAIDADKLLLGCRNGVLDLRTGAFREHRRTDRLTKCCAVDYDQDARAPAWERFIAEAMGGDAELIAYLQTLAGYALSGERGEHMLPIFHGQGANGKSTALGVLTELLGDYAGAAPPGLLIARSGNEHPAGLAALKGMRLVVASETSETGRLNESQVKLLTGSDRISARHMYGDFFQFDPQHLILLQTNHKPRVTGVDAGIWRRLKLVPFNVIVPPEKRDAKLPEKLRAELAGVLNWCVVGWRMYQAQGFKEPAAVQVATAEYRSASDVIGAFIEDCCLLGPAHTASSADLHDAYKFWADSKGEREISQRELGLKLAERPGLESVRTARERRWHGISVDAAGKLRLEVVPAQTAQGVT